MIHLNKMLSKIHLSKMLSNGLAPFSTLKGLLQLVVGISFLFACSQAEINIGSVPITLQTVGLLVMGLAFPRKLLVAVVRLYLLLGLLGLPLFAGYTGGILMFLTPRGGYLVGFGIAAEVMAYLRGKFGEATWLALALYGLVGELLVFAAGLAWLTYLMGWSSAIQVGLLPFLFTELCKIFVVSLVVYPIKKNSKSK